jgi:carnitine O-acetyltransferase
MASDEETGTYSLQHKLPRLPIPELADTCRKFLAAADPLLSDAGKAEANREMEAFLATDGPELHAALLEYDKEPGRASYVEDFWTSSYLNYDDPVVLNLNPFFVLEDDPTPSRSNQIARATSLILSSLKFASALANETLPPDVWRGNPLCMVQFKRLFGSSRRPDGGADSLVTAENPRNLVVMSRSQVGSRLSQRP